MKTPSIYVLLRHSASTNTGIVAFTTEAAALEAAAEEIRLSLDGLDDDSAKDIRESLDAKAYEEAIDLWNEVDSQERIEIEAVELNGDLQGWR